VPSSAPSSSGAALGTERVTVTAAARVAFGHVNRAVAAAARRGTAHGDVDTAIDVLEKFERDTGDTAFTPSRIC